MKHAVIIGLVAVNVVLLTVLLLGGHSQPAYGQAVRGATDYLVTTGHFDKDYDAMYVIDVGRRRMCYFLFDRTTKKMVATGARKLLVDFPVEQPKP